MEDSIIVSEFEKATEHDSIFLSSRYDEPDAEPSEALLAIIMCLCLVAMIGLVVVLVVTASDFARAGPTIPGTDDFDAIVVPEFPLPSIRISQTTTTKRPMRGSPRITAPQTSTEAPIVKLIICTVSERAISEAMYPPDKYCDYLFYTNVFPYEKQILPVNDNVSWAIFQEMGLKYKVMELGVSFDISNIALDDISDAFVDIYNLRGKGIRHYGILTEISAQFDFLYNAQRTQRALEKLKEIQGADRTAKTVLAMGAYLVGTYAIDTFAGDFERTFVRAANNYMADIIITIVSSGWTSIRGACFAAPPNVLRRPFPNITDIAENWFVVSRTMNYTKRLLITGMGFEIATLQYVLEQNATSLNGSVFSPCLSVKKVGLPALCSQQNFSRHSQFYLGNEWYTYGVISNTTGVLTLSEYFATLVLKFRKARTLLNGFRDRTAWLLFNVQNEDLNNECPDPPFSVIRLFCRELKGPGEQRCQ